MTTGGADLREERVRDSGPCRLEQVQKDAAKALAILEVKDGVISGLERQVDVARAEVCELSTKADELSAELAVKEAHKEMSVAREAAPFEAEGRSIRVERSAALSTLAQSESQAAMRHVGGSEIRDQAQGSAKTQPSEHEVKTVSAQTDGSGPMGWLGEALRKNDEDITRLHTLLQREIADELSVLHEVDFDTELHMFRGEVRCLQRECEQSQASRVEMLSIHVHLEAAHEELEASFANKEIHLEASCVAQESRAHRVEVEMEARFSQAAETEASHARLQQDLEDLVRDRHEQLRVACNCLNSLGREMDPAVGALSGRVLVLTQTERVQQRRLEEAEQEAAQLIASQLNHEAVLDTARMKVAGLEIANQSLEQRLAKSYKDVENKTKQWRRLAWNFATTESDTHRAHQTIRRYEECDALQQEQIRDLQDAHISHLACERQVLETQLDRLHVETDERVEASASVLVENFMTDMSKQLIDGWTDVAGRHYEIPVGLSSLLERIVAQLSLLQKQAVSSKVQVAIWQQYAMLCADFDARRARDLFVLRQRILAWTRQEEKHRHRYPLTIVSALENQAHETDERILKSFRLNDSLETAVAELSTELSHAKSESTDLERRVRSMKDSEARDRCELLWTAQQEALSQRTAWRDALVEESIVAASRQGDAREFGLELAVEELTSILQDATARVDALQLQNVSLRAQLEKSDSGAVKPFNSASVCVTSDRVSELQHVMQHNSHVSTLQSELSWARVEFQEAREWEDLSRDIQLAQSSRLARSLQHIPNAQLSDNEYHPSATKTAQIACSSDSGHMFEKKTAATQTGRCALTEKMKHVGTQFGRSPVTDETQTILLQRVEAVLSVHHQLQVQYGVAAEQLAHLKHEHSTEVARAERLCEELAVADAQRGFLRRDEMWTTQDEEVRRLGGQTVPTVQEILRLQLANHQKSQPVCAAQQNKHVIAFGSIEDRELEPELHACSELVCTSQASRAAEDILRVEVQLAEARGAHLTAGPLPPMSRELGGNGQGNLVSEDDVTLQRASEEHLALEWRNECLSREVQEAELQRTSESVALARDREAVETKEESLQRMSEECAALMLQGRREVRELLDCQQRVSELEGSRDRERFAQRRLEKLEHDARRREQRQHANFLEHEHFVKENDQLKRQISELYGLLCNAHERFDAVIDEQTLADASARRDDDAWQREFVASRSREAALLQEIDRLRAISSKVTKLAQSPASSEPASEKECHVSDRKESRRLQQHLVQEREHRDQLLKRVSSLTAELSEQQESARDLEHQTRQLREESERRRTVIATLQNRSRKIDESRLLQDRDSNEELRQTVQQTKREVTRKSAVITELRAEISEARQWKSEQQRRDERNEVRQEADLARARALRAESQRLEQALRSEHGRAQALQERLCEQERESEISRTRLSRVKMRLEATRSELREQAGDRVALSGSLAATSATAAHARALDSDARQGVDQSEAVSNSPPADAILCTADDSAIKETLKILNLCPDDLSEFMAE